MTSRDRVFRALEFRSPDRAPRDLWPLPYIGMFRGNELDRFYHEFPGDVAYPALRMGEGERVRGEQNRKGLYVDAWGCPFLAAEEGVIGEVKDPPLADWSALAGLRAPWEILKNADWSTGHQSVEENLASANPRFMLCGTSLRPFERMQFLRGSEALFMDLAYDTAEVRKLRDIVHEFHLAELEHLCKLPVDGLSFMDDWGSQTSLLISPAMWRAFFKPLYRQYCDRIRAAGKKVFFHSDGNIRAIYDDLVELGVDAVNSQLFVMDIEELGRTFRGKITFWGEIDRQWILPFGTTEDVRRAVGRVRRAFDDGTGGVFAHCEWGTTVGLENIQTVMRAWLEPIESLP